MTEVVHPYHAAQLVEELERRISPLPSAAPMLGQAPPSIAVAPDVVPTVPGVPEPPD
jgi:hypothetical protein